MAIRLECFLWNVDNSLQRPIKIRVNVYVDSPLSIIVEAGVTIAGLKAQIQDKGGILTPQLQMASLFSVCDRGRKLEEDSTLGECMHPRGFSLDLVHPRLSLPWKCSSCERFQWALFDENMVHPAASPESCSVCLDAWLCGDCLTTCHESRCPCLIPGPPPGCPPPDRLLPPGPPQQESEPDWEWV